MRNTSILACCLSGVFTFGCTLDSDEQEHFGEVENALVVLDSWTPNWRDTCEGYTPEGGQRVRGEVQLINQSLGNGKIRHSVKVAASNWIHNVFGWNTKRTSALRIEGLIYFETSSVAYYTSVDVDTGGELKDKINELVTFSDDYSTYAYVEASLNFSGRHSTHCSL